MAKQKLILLVSGKMDSNRKEDRNENSLIRMSSTAREHIGFGEDKVELWPANSSGEDRINKSLMLTVFQAFQADITKAKKMVQDGELSEKQLKNIGFVSSRTFNRLCGKKKGAADNIWISNDIHDTVMGSDPEFLVFEKDRNVVVSAANILSKAGEIGCDGAMAEIRPKPEVSVVGLVRNMHKIFDKNRALMEKYRLLSACYHEDENRGYPVGGHIHVGNPKQLINETSETRTRFYRTLNKIMDELLTVPLIRIDGKEGKKRRSKKAMHSGYGHYGDFRTDHGRLEHRTLSGMWLLHPSLSKAVLGTAKAIIDEVFRLIADKKFDKNYILPAKFTRRNLFSEDMDSWDEVPLAKDMCCIAPSDKMIKLLGDSDTKIITVAYLEGWYSKLKKLSTYKANRKYIDALNEILKIKPQEISRWDRSIETNWLSGKKFLVDL